MILLAWLLLQAVTTVQPVDEVWSIPADDWRFLKLAEALAERADTDLIQKPALLVARFEVIPPTQQARLALVRLEDLDLMKGGQPNQELTGTPFLSRGSLAYHVPAAGDYVIVVDNRGQPAAQVRLRVRLDFSAVTRLSRQKQLTVILISFAAFFAVVTWSARRLLRAIRR